MELRFVLKALFLGLLSQRISASGQSSERKLSQELFLSYEPSTTVTDYAALDLDLRDMISEFAKGTLEGRENAYRIYTQGSYSKSYAKLTLNDALLVDVAKGTTLLGLAADGTQVLGSAREDAKKGENSIDFLYHATTIQERWTNCHVGGSPSPNLEGCLASAGAVEIGDIGSYSYVYEPKEENLNARSFQTLSTDAQKHLYDCGTGCPYPTYSKYYDFYGIHTYGDSWISSAFNGTETNFREGNADFSGYNGEKKEGANEAIIKGAVVLNLWMYVYKELEHAAAKCVLDSTCSDADCSNEDRMHSWDKGVAFYTGGEPKMTGYGGYLLFSLAEKFCSAFGTCSTAAQDEGMAMVNVEIFKGFRQGKSELLVEECEGVFKNVKRITELMTVPLIQGVLRFAYQLENPPVNGFDHAKIEAEGATYAAALLPLVFACGNADAEVLYNSMRIGNLQKPNFKVVKSVLENNYDCLGVTCFDVGGLVDATQDGAYMPGAEPCGGAGPSEATTSPPSPSSVSNAKKESNPNVGRAAGITVFFVLAALIVAVVLSRRKPNRDPDLRSPAEVEWT